MSQNTVNVLIGAEAGQGLVTLGYLVSKGLVRSGYAIVVTRDYQSRIRGGHNTHEIRVSDTPLAAPQEAVDILVALDGQTMTLHEDRLSDGALVLADAALGLDDAKGVLSIPFKDLGKTRVANVLAFGVLASLFGLSRDAMAQVLEDFFGKRHPEAVEQNREALDKGYEWATEHAPAPGRLPPPPGDPPVRAMVNGNEAIALGALAAGVKFCSFYPMTPATSINLGLITHAHRMGVVVEQAEDEIAAINMALGASYAGAPSMVATSGGGFALMAEGVSLAAQIETPIVVAVAQRPGPATGLPTRTEQGDLEFVLHAGHGEFPRAVFAPGSIDECFHLTHKAFHLAERYQSPVFVLTDQFLADSYRAVKPFDTGAVDPVAAGADPPGAAAPYKRFALTEDGVSPRLIPGASEHLVVVDSDEHTEDGRLTEDLDVRKQMVEKRLRKHNGICKDVVPPEWTGDDNPDLLLVSWGSTKGAAAEAVAALHERGTRAAHLHFAQVWPLVPDQFIERLESAGRVVCVEGNALGQFARLLRRETGFEIRRHVRRYDGLPFTPEYILRALDEGE